MTGSSLRSTQSLAGNAAAAAGAAAIAFTRGAAERMHNQRQLMPAASRPALRPSTLAQPGRFRSFPRLPQLRRRDLNPAVFASALI